MQKISIKEYFKYLKISIRLEAIIFLKKVPFSNGTFEISVIWF